MEASGRFGKSGPGRSGQMFSGRRGSLLVALIAAVIAGLLIYLFVSNYHKKNAAAPVTPTSATVFVAEKYIPAGTPETQIVAQNLLKSEVVPSTQVIAGAISDPSAIAGEVAAASIAAGQQVTLADFSHTNVTISAYLTGSYRAIGIATDAIHNLTSYIGVGSKIDVVAGLKGTTGAATVELFNNVTVLAVNPANYVVLRLTQRQVLNLTNAELLGYTIWFTLRPLTGATNSVPQNFVAKVIS
jgi:Flp pilus assembly protein CpaB